MSKENLIAKTLPPIGHNGFEGDGETQGKTYFLQFMAVVDPVYCPYS